MSNIQIRDGMLCLPLEPAYVPIMNAFQGHVTPEAGGTIVVPYTPAAVNRVNRAFHLDIFGPAFSSWSYGGRFPPYLHQRMTVDFLTQNPRAFVLNGMGTGKTSSAIWAAEYLLSRKMIDRALILSPLSTLGAVWKKEIFTLRPQRTVAIAHGSKDKRQTALNSGATYVITNHDALRLDDMAPDRLANEFQLVICDEATAYKTWSSGSAPLRYKRMFQLAHKVEWLWLLTGTPTPNTPLDAWALIRLVNKDFQMSRIQFQNMTMQQVSEFRWLPKPDAHDTVARMLQPSIRFSKSQVLASLPPKIFVERQVELSPEQKAARKEMKRAAMIEFKDKTVTAANAAVLISKLLQISAGMVYAEQGDAVELDYKPRFEAITDLISEAGDGKFLIFSMFTEVVHRLRRDLKTAGFKVAEVHGGTPLGRRTEIFESFQNGDLQGIIAHPGTMAHGVTLTAAQLEIWATPIMSNELYEQANERAHRPGQKNSVVIANIWATPEEEAVFKRLRARGAVQSAVLGLVEEFMQ